MMRNDYMDFYLGNTRSSKQQKRRCKNCGRDLRSNEGSLCKTCEKKAWMKQQPSSDIVNKTFELATATMFLGFAAGMAGMMMQND